MVLDLNMPASADWAALQNIIPGFLSYVLSFIYVAIYWNNHRHFLQTVRRVDGVMLWANMHLLFWLLLIPLTTGWMQEKHTATAQTSVYGIVLLMAAVAYFILQRIIICSHGADSVLQQALGSDIKGKISPVFYISGVLLAFCSPLLAQIIYAAVALIWLVPDRRIEKKLAG